MQLSKKLDVPRIAAMTNEILVRAGSLPISVTSEGFQFIIGDHVPTSTFPIIETVMQNRSRVRHLSLTFPHLVLRPLLYSNPGLMESLESVEIRFNHWNTPHLDYGETRAFSAARRLRKVHVTQTEWRSVGVDYGALCFPWAQLTNINFNDLHLSYATLLQILPQCTCLVECTLTPGTPDDPSSGPWVDEIALPYLRSLTFHVPYRPADAFRGYLTIPKLLQLLSLPSLQAFTFDCSSNHASPDHELRDLIARSGCSLESFTSDLSTTADIQSLLEAMPHLIRLTLSVSYTVSPPILDLIECGDLVPDLEEITCTVASVSDFLRVLESRCSGTSASPNAHPSYPGIRRAVIHKENGSSWEAGIDDRVREIRKTGKEEGREFDIILD